MNPRLLVLTDISSLTPGLREPDDGQSMVRLMLYTNEIEIEGLIGSSNMGHGQVCRPELIQSVVEAYGQVRDSLLRHDPNYPPVEALARGIHAGQPVAGPHTAVEDSIGAGKDTDASQWILQVIQRPDPRPLWVSVWGGTADLAQALWRLRETAGEAQTESLLANLRIHAVVDQDSTGPWIKQEFPTLYYITRGFGIRGMYRGGDCSLVSAQWVETNLRQEHGALGALYPNYDGGDIWHRQLGPVKGIKEGDTPSYLGLIHNGLNPEIVAQWGAWGGRFVALPDQPLRYVDAIDDSLPADLGDLQPHLSATYRWRPAFQDDFAARMDWCVNDYSGANHPPQVRVEVNRVAGDERGALAVHLSAGDWLELDASTSSDPDGDRLSFHWWLYPEPGSYRGALEIHGAHQPQARLQAPLVSQPAELHLILAVTDQGNPPLTSYRRVLLFVQP